MSRDGIKVLSKSELKAFYDRCKAEDHATEVNPTHRLVLCTGNLPKAIVDTSPFGRRFNEIEFCAAGGKGTAREVV